MNGAIEWREFPGAELSGTILHEGNEPEFPYKLFLMLSLWRLNFTCGNVPEELSEQSFQWGRHCLGGKGIFYGDFFMGITRGEGRFPSNI